MNKNQKPRTIYRMHEKADAWDYVHAILCLAICVCVVLIFVDNTVFYGLFPVVFLLAAFMNLSNAMRLIIPDKQGRRNIPGFIMFLVVGLIAGIVGVALANVVWFS